MIKFKIIKKDKKTEEYNREFLIWQAQIIKAFALPPDCWKIKVKK
jgi:hypothetical protein